MNTLTDPVKRIARDLVDKKLWPVAVLLLVALVAIPILIGGGSSADDAAAPVAAVTAPAPGAPGSKSLITVADQTDGGKDTRPGRIDDPFYDPPEPPAAESGSSTSAPAAGAGASGSGATSNPGSSSTPAGSSGGGTPSGDTPPQTTTPPQSSDPVARPAYYRTEVRWYETTKAKARPIARLTPLGGVDDTAALYLGVTKSSSSYAVFLLGPTATSDGEAKCEDESGCRVFGLKAGQTQRVTVQPADGGPARQYVLDVVAVKTIETDAATARTMRAKVHSDGREAMRKMWQDRPTAVALRPIQYDRDSGLLVKSATPSGDADSAIAPVE